MRHRALCYGHDFSNDGGWSWLQDPCPISDHFAESQTIILRTGETDSINSLADMFRKRVLHVLWGASGRYNIK